MNVGASTAIASCRFFFSWKRKNNIFWKTTTFQSKQLLRGISSLPLQTAFQLFSLQLISFYPFGYCAAQLYLRKIFCVSRAKMAQVLKSRRAVEGTAPAVGSNEKIGGSFIPTQNPAFLKFRLALWEKLYTQQQNALQEKAKLPISIHLPDGKVLDGLSYQTTPMKIAREIFSKGAEKFVVAKVLYLEQNPDLELANFAMNEEDASFSKSTDSGILWDLSRPLEGSCHLQFLRFEDAEGKIVFWHSSAHILGEALELLYGAHLTVGPPLTSGFYYDSFVGELTFTEEDLTKLTSTAEEIVKQNQPFERLLCTKEEALELFVDNPFKQQLISSKIPDGSKTTCYRCGTLIDLCRGPHIFQTGKVAAFAIVKHSAANWLGKIHLDALQRVYGIAFPEKKQLKEYFFYLEEAKRRDHRLVGNFLNFFFFEPSVSAGSCFWLPAGARLYLKLCDFIRKEYRLRGYQEVISPNLYNCDLWKTSGHYQNYKENLFIINVEEKEWGLKPMNCPGHCVMFKHLSPSYRQLPLRFADFGVLHRNEFSGSLSGLTRVRRFQQDDAHIFCTMEQIEEEVLAVLQFLFFVYDRFGFQYELKLSTRPEKALGSKETWAVAENALKEALNKSEKPWSENAGDGAFYGPKIDVCLWDALKRSHQCGTIQLDFQLPLRFNLMYRDQEAGVVRNDKREDSDPLPTATPVEEEFSLFTSVSSPSSTSEDSTAHELPQGMRRPVIIHRAVLGSVERMCAVLIEHTAGKFPFWLSPRQAIVLPINARNVDYGHWIKNTLHNFGYDVSIDDSNNTINKKIRTAQVHQWNYLLVVGDREATEQTVTVRNRDSPQNQSVLSVPDLLKLFEDENQPYSDKFNSFTPWKGKSAGNGETETD